MTYDKSYNVMSNEYKKAILSKYNSERLKRLKPEGTGQYINVSDVFTNANIDPYNQVKNRNTKHDHVNIAVIGGGFAGLITAAQLSRDGFEQIRIVEKGGDFGGVWYWNRYPGIRCDTASMIYMPLLEETDYMPTEKYATGEEIRKHCYRIANFYDLYKHALLHTEATNLTWDSAKSNWKIETNRGDQFSATYVVFGIGALHIPKLPKVFGLGSFRGHSFHTSLWDHKYTGCNEYLENLADKSVGIIGTGATAIQCIPRVAACAKSLTVFQRTPSAINMRGNKKIDIDWFKRIATPGWQEHWRSNFIQNRNPRIEVNDLVNDGWTAISNRVREKILNYSINDLSEEDFRKIEYEVDLDTMENIRNSIKSTVKDKNTANSLLPWYAQFCKRPCFHDSYLETFNLSNVKLVDTEGKGIEQITETGIKVQGKNYPMDCIIFSSGFSGSFFEQFRKKLIVIGKGGVRLSDHWQNGMRSLHGIHVNGFPNAFFVQPSQGANFLSNLTHNFIASSLAISKVLCHVKRMGFGEVEAKKTAEDLWMKELASAKRRIGSVDCTPGIFNNEGNLDEPAAKNNLGYPKGAAAYFEYLDNWCNCGQFKGLYFS